MATYTVSAGHKGVGPFALTASTVDTVSFTDNVAGVVQVVNPGTNSDPVYVRTDGTNPTVPTAGQSTAALYVPAGSVLDVEVRGETDSVKVISAGTPTIVVQVRDA
jgi:hypothetical protein